MWHFRLAGPWASGSQVSATLRYRVSDPCDTHEKKMNEASVARRLLCTMGIDSGITSVRGNHHESPSISRDYARWISSIGSAQQRAGFCRRQTETGRAHRYRLVWQV